MKPTTHTQCFRMTFSFEGTAAHAHTRAIVTRQSGITWHHVVGSGSSKEQRLRSQQRSPGISNPVGLFSKVEEHGGSDRAVAARSGTAAHAHTRAIVSQA